MVQKCQLPAVWDSGSQAAQLFRFVEMHVSNVQITEKLLAFLAAAAAPAAEPADAPLYLPYKTLVSSLSSTVFSEGEAHRLIEILSEKGGIVQDTWHTVC